MSLTDVGRLALDKDRLALDRERARSQAIRELLLTYSSVKSGKRSIQDKSIKSPFGSEMVDPSIT